MAAACSAREPRPDAPHWPGRRVFAAVDAAIWPLLWVAVFAHAPRPVGVVGPFVATVALLSVWGRLRRALWINHRYRFNDLALGLRYRGVAADGRDAEIGFSLVAERRCEPSSCQWVTTGRAALHRSRSVCRHATARVPIRTGVANVCSAIIL